MEPLFDPSDELVDGVGLGVERGRRDDPLRDQPARGILGGGGGCGGPTQPLASNKGGGGGGGAGPVPPCGVGRRIMGGGGGGGVPGQELTEPIPLVELDDETDAMDMVVAKMSESSSSARSVKSKSLISSGRSV